MIRDELGQIELAVLGSILSQSNRAYGVQIWHHLEAETGKAMPIGSVYAVLDKLRTKGYVKSKLAEATPVRGGRAKQYFSVTAEGKAAAAETRRAMERIFALVPKLSGA